MRKAVLLALVLLSCAARAQVPAATAELPAEVAGGFSVPVTSLRETTLRWKFRSTIPQQYDFSCGSAAVATLLTYHYGAPTSEAAAIQVMYARGDQLKIRREGFSLLDMKLYLEQRGFRSDGFEATLEQIVGFGAPGIVLMQDNGYRHFVVLKGVRGSKVLLGDPALGGRILERADFERLWLGHIFFVIHSHREQAAFNVAAQWQLAPSAVLGDALQRDSLVSITLMRPDRQREF